MSERPAEGLDAGEVEQIIKHLRPWPTRTTIASSKSSAARAQPTKMKRAARLVPIGAAAAVTVFFGASALAVECYGITSDSVTQFYDVRSPTGIPVLMRARRPRSA